MDAPLAAFSAPVTLPDAPLWVVLAPQAPQAGAAGGSAFAALLLDLLPAEGDPAGVLPVRDPAAGAAEDSPSHDDHAAEAAPALPALLAALPSFAVSSPEAPEEAQTFSGSAGDGTVAPLARGVLPNAGLPSGAVSGPAGPELPADHAPLATASESESYAAGRSGAPEGATPEVSDGSRAEGASPPVPSEGMGRDLPPMEGGGGTSFDPAANAAPPEPPPPEPPTDDSRAVRTVGSAQTNEPPADGLADGSREQQPQSARRTEVRDLVQALPPVERGARGLPRADEAARVHADEHSAVQRAAASGSAAPPSAVRQMAPAAGEWAGTNPPEAPVLPEPLRPVADAVVELDRRGSEARIQLDPPELGDVVIRIQRSADGLHIDVRVDRPETLQLFTAHRAAFEAQLGQRGLAVAGLAIDLAGSGTGGRGSQEEELPVRADGSFGALLGVDAPRVSPLQRRARLAYNPDGRLVLWA